ncbi:hypothetical protein D3C80_1581830 [compost metagenome]
MQALALIQTAIGIRRVAADGQALGLVTGGEGAIVSPPFQAGETAAPGHRDELETQCLGLLDQTEQLQIEA